MCSTGRQGVIAKEMSSEIDSALAVTCAVGMYNPLHQFFFISVLFADYTQEA